MLSAYVSRKKQRNNTKIRLNVFRCTNRRVIWTIFHWINRRQGILSRLHNEIEQVSTIVKCINTNFPFVSLVGIVKCVLFCLCVSDLSSSFGGFMWIVSASFCRQIQIPKCIIANCICKTTLFPPFQPQEVKSKSSDIFNTAKLFSLFWNGRLCLLGAYLSSSITLSNKSTNAIRMMSELRKKSFCFYSGSIFEIIPLQRL